MFLMHDIRLFIACWDSLCGLLSSARFLIFASIVISPHTHTNTRIFFRFNNERLPLNNFTVWTINSFRASCLFCLISIGYLGGCAIDSTPHREHTVYKHGRLFCFVNIDIEFWFTTHSFALAQILSRDFIDVCNVCIRISIIYMYFSNGNSISCIYLCRCHYRKNEEFDLLTFAEKEMKNSNYNK